jgi:hypothetical protein
MFQSELVLLSTEHNSALYKFNNYVTDHNLIGGLFVFYASCFSIFTTHQPPLWVLCILVIRTALEHTV